MGDKWETSCNGHMSIAIQSLSRLEATILVFFRRQNGNKGVVLLSALVIVWATLLMNWHPGVQSCPRDAAKQLHERRECSRFGK